MNRERVIQQALGKWRSGEPLTPIEQMIVAYHPDGTSAGCASCHAVRPYRFKVTES